MKDQKRYKLPIILLLIVLFVILAGIASAYASGLTFSTNGNAGIGSDDLWGGQTITNLSFGFDLANNRPDVIHYIYFHTSNLGATPKLWVGVDRTNNGLANDWWECFVVSGNDWACNLFTAPLDGATNVNQKRAYQFKNILFVEGNKFK